MKSYATTETTNFSRVTIPFGKKLPHAPQAGEVFFLTQSMEEHHTMQPWHPRGVYVHDGMVWQPMVEPRRMRCSAPIGSQDIEFENSRVKLTDQPVLSKGHELAQVSLQPTNIRASLSGTATMWLDATAASHVWAVLWRGNTIIGLGMQFVEPLKPTTLAMTFHDTPRSEANLTYSLRLYSDLRTGTVYVNRGTNVTFDGVSQTALILEENT